jgi:hypothetical protein
MKRNIPIINIAMTFVTVSFVWGILCMPVSAHEGHIHKNVDTLASTTPAELKRMEDLLTLLKQLVTLLSTLRIQQSYVSAAPVIVQDEMKEHHEEHSQATSTEPTEDPVAEVEFIIEVETHHDDTHVHIRYVDKPEEMFFADASIDDEDQLVTEVSTRTGLTPEVVREALVYFR